ncbi:MAG: hypothetical protein ACK5QC_12370 [Bacteroidota bacterium]
MVKQVLFKISMLILPLVIFFSFAEIILNKYPTSYSKIKNNFTKCEPKIDVIFIGASESQLGIAPKYISSFSSFNLSNSSQTIYNSCKLIESNLTKLPKLKTVVLSIGPLMLKSSYSKNIEKWREKFYYHYWHIIPESGEYSFSWKFKCGIYDVGTIVQSVFMRNKFEKSLSNIHKIDSLGWEYGEDDANESIVNSSMGKETVKIHLTETDLHNNSNEKYIKNLYTLLKQYGIKLILIQPPTSQYYYNSIPSVILDSNIIALNRLITEDKILFYNFQSDSTFTNNDFRDVNHLNFIGAKKLSLKINEILKSNIK